ncbi:hypothetical protein [Pseudobacteroides cellulosolvens]|uniref:Uncharacterized protein n=1 Tax=Pseudobacteroides cellulosolvens ATCC 35603 = DSM 2933 TaxID=398512 RepID=A0A0L6JJD5_9FIRM|nr:hypothetical protein [Pseudobacteroides cellulosolvens]KNY25850.1 hypothetical protein Bccel_1110 [Pseudobacteroides cellulosolvens ATCC 35603 = DSM 2933]
MLELLGGIIEIIFDNKKVPKWVKLLIGTCLLLPAIILLLLGSIVSLFSKEIIRAFLGLIFAIGLFLLWIFFLYKSKKN